MKWWANLENFLKVDVFVWMYAYPEPLISGPGPIDRVAYTIWNLNSAT